MKVPTSTLTWLLEPDDPPIRYLTQTEVLGLDPSADEVQASWRSRMAYAPTRAILAQGAEFWNDRKGAYGKYDGMYWQVIFLGQFLADGDDPSLRPGLDGLLDDPGWVHPRGMQCLTANLLGALLRMGVRAPARVADELESLAARVLRDGGVACEAMSYSLLDHCYMSIPKLLLCFLEIPDAERTTTVREAMTLLVDELLAHEVLVYVPGHQRRWRDEVLASAPKAAELPKGETVKAWIASERARFLERHGPGECEVKPGWRRFGFPRHYNSDALEASYALARAGVDRCEALEPALALIESKADAAARWRMDDSLNGKMRVDVETKGAPSKWLTLRALATLRHFGTVELASPAT